jgi:hypothetical protein
VPPRLLHSRIPRDLETITLKCLEKEPRRRYRSAAHLANDLRYFAEGKPISARRARAPERLWRWCRRNPVVALLTAAVFVALLAGTIIASLFALQANREARHAREQKLLSDRRLYRGGVEQIGLAIHDGENLGFAK